MDESTKLYLVHNFLIFFRSFSASDKDKKDKELDLYEKIHRCERNCDVLSWWKENSVILPALCQELLKLSFVFLQVP